MISTLYVHHLKADNVYLTLLKTSYGILWILNFDWLMHNGMYMTSYTYSSYCIPLTSNILGVCIFCALIIANFEVFLWVFFIKQLLFYPRLDMRYSQLGATHLIGYLPSRIQCALAENTLRHGLSVCAPIILKPLPGVYFPPTANAMIVDWFLVTKYWIYRENNAKSACKPQNTKYTEQTYQVSMQVTWNKIIIGHMDCKV